MRILVCGGREYNAYWVLKEELGKLSLRHKITEIIEGGAKGADALAREWAHRCGIKNTTFTADWLGEGPKAGPLRNQRMLDEGKPDLVVAFPGGKGTADMVKRARKAGVPVREVR
jgi:hypothetical protein